MKNWRDELKASIKEISDLTCDREGARVVYEKDREVEKILIRLIEQVEANAITNAMSVANSYVINKTVGSPPFTVVTKAFYKKLLEEL